MSGSIDSLDDSYEGWIGKDGVVDEMWQTTNGESFAITDDAVFLPNGIGPLEGEQQLEYAKIDGVDVEEVFEDNVLNTTVVLGGGVVLGGAGWFIGHGIGMLLITVGFLAILTSIVMAVKDRHTDARTNITVHMDQFETTVELNGAVGKDIADALDIENVNKNFRGNEDSETA